MPLNIVIVGAGIAGLVAASSLRQAGHNVIVLEKSTMSNVVGAALHVHPNGGRVLAHLGFDTVRAQVCRPSNWDILRGDNFKQLTSMPLSMTPGHPEPGSFTIHRGDLHEELLRLATMEGGHNDLWGPPVEIWSGLTARCISEDGMGVVLESGQEVRGDLIVAADGVHSAIRDYVAQEPVKANHSGMAAFRFLLDSDQLQDDEELASLWETSKGRVSMLADTTQTDKERHIVFYACHNGNLQNFVGIHPSASSTIEDATEELKTAMKSEFSHFDPRVQKIISLCKHIKRWPLFIHDPLPTWVRGRVVLIGDAAHPMLPFGGQGATQGMEDAAVLGYLFNHQKGQKLEDTLALFEAIRKNRATRVQILSSTRAGRESQVSEKIAPYLDETAPKAPMSLPERVQHDFSYDVYAACEKALSDRMEEDREVEPQLFEVQSQGTVAA